MMQLQYKRSSSVQVATGKKLSPCYKNVHFFLTFRFCANILFWYFEFWNSQTIFFQLKFNDFFLRVFILKTQMHPNVVNAFVRMNHLKFPYLSENRICEIESNSR